MVRAFRVVALGAGLCLFACSSGSPPGGSDGATGTIPADGGAPDSSGGPGPPIEGGVVGSANTIIGLDPGGGLVRIGLGADGHDKRLGYPKFNGVEMRNIVAIARGPGSVFGLNREVLKGGNLVDIDLLTLNAKAANHNFDRFVGSPDSPPSHSALASNGSTFFGSQGGSIVRLGADGTRTYFALRQFNDETGADQCFDPVDLAWSGGLLGAGLCAGVTATAMGTSHFVWEYLFGMPLPNGTGGTPTNKRILYSSPERIEGLSSAGAGALVAVSSNGNLLVLQGRSFVVLRKLEVAVHDLE
ncbi:MAG: hypothetical protein SGI86_11950 [Deltaproteobacteria bacterium]|mgnify:CR=1 FL=1|nr:hypothetical protein [Deltaproteobacteria bacterium]